MNSHLWVTADELSNPALPEAHTAALSASYLMWALSGRKYGGVREVTERYTCPCRCGITSLGATLLSALPYMDNVRLFNLPACGRCGHNHRLRLRGRPIQQIVSVSVAGTILTPDQYEIQDDAYLAPAPGQSWSICRGVDVSYTYGVAPPEAGRRAARLLAEELLKASIDPDRCQLPDRVTSVSRQGVSWTILDPQSFLDEGRLGLYEVDAFLRAVNPNKSRKPARVWSPDLPRPARIRAPRVAQAFGPDDLLVRRGMEFTRLFLAEDLDADVSDLDWTPSAEITMWNGSEVFDASSYFTADSGDPSGSVRFTIPQSETLAVNLRSGDLHLYAVIDGDEPTVVHLLTSQVYVK